MASRQSVPVAGIAGLQRAARHAGEVFGHEDVIVAPVGAEVLTARTIGWLAALAAAVGLAILHFS